MHPQNRDAPSLGRLGPAIPASVAAWGCLRFGVLTWNSIGLSVYLSFIRALLFVSKRYVFGKHVICRKVTLFLLVCKFHSCLHRDKHSHMGEKIDSFKFDRTTIFVYFYSIIIIIIIIIIIAQKLYTGSFSFFFTVKPTRCKTS
jgi:fumarate reductase subunit D